jgi:hypothetical protein
MYLLGNKVSQDLRKETKGAPQNHWEREPEIEVSPLFLATPWRKFCIGTQIYQ